MSYGKISAKQKEILEYIKDQIINRGFPPSVRDICEAVHLKSTSSVHSHLEALEKNGYIRRDPAKPRTIEIVDDNFNITRRELVSVPIIGTITAGQPILAVENIEGYFPIPAEYMPNEQTFMLKVKGESADAATGALNYISQKYPNATPIVATATGRLLWEVNFDDQSTAPAPGTEVKEGAPVAHIEASYAVMPLPALKGGKLIDTCAKQGQMVKKGDVLGWVE